MRRTLTTAPIAALAIGAGALVLGAAPATAAVEAQPGTIGYSNDGVVLETTLPGAMPDPYERPYDAIVNASDVDVTVAWTGTWAAFDSYSIEIGGTTCVRAGETVQLGNELQQATRTDWTTVGCSE